MALAMIHPDLEKRGRGKKSLKIEEFKIASGYVSMARTVFAETPKLAPAVVSGSMALHDAYERAKLAGVSEEAEAERHEARLAVLRRKEPELADAVVEGKLTLEGAEAECEARERQRAQDWADLRGTFMLSAGERAIEEHDRSRR